MSLGEPSKIQVVCESAWLAVASVILVTTFLVNGLSSYEIFGFKNGTGEVSDIFETQVTPSGFTFIIWGFIYTWQVLWIIYAWSFLCRQKMTRTIFVGVFIGYTLVNLTNITWIYVWGNLYVSAASGLLILFNILFYPTLAMLVVYFHKIRSHGEANKWDILLTWIFPVNGLFFYATWTTIASLINLTAAFQYSSDIDVSATNSGTIALSLLLVMLVVYFVLENTVFDRFLRYVLSVYPVLIWALIGVLTKHWGNEGEERNSQFTLGLLIISIVAFVVRIGLVIVFTVFRPINTKTEYNDV